MRTRVGYAGGTRADPTYARIGDHTETVEIDYDPTRISYEDLLALFFSEHDARRGSLSKQYRSAVFYRTDEERAAAQAAKARIEDLVGHVSTSVEPLRAFYRAEDYHQKYYLRGRRHIMSEFREMFPEERSFADSAAAARVNGWIGGCGSRESLDRDLPLVGLSDATQAELRALASRRA